MTWTACINSPDSTDPPIILGVVEWQNGWRQYVFVPRWETVYAANCLRDLAAFVQEVNEAKKVAR